MNRILFALMLSILLNISKAQPLRELKVGDTLPPVNITYLDGDKLKQTTLSSLIKDKFVIIDFWATWCAACLRSMAEGDSLSKAMNGKFLMLPVTYESSTKVVPFAQRNPILKKLNLPYVVDDSLLMGGYFKFAVLPHHVWVDNTGIIQAITYPDQLTYENVISFIGKKELIVEEKNDDIDFDMLKPLKTGDSAFLYRSLLTAYRSGLSNQMGTFAPSMKEDAKTNRFFAINKDMLSLFYAAYSCNNGPINMNRVEINVHDSIGLNPFFVNNGHPTRILIKANCFCYELRLPTQVSLSVLYNFVLNDLNRFSPYVATIEKRTRKCWALINKDKSKNPVGSNSKTRIVWNAGFVQKMYNKPMYLLVEYLNWNLELPLVDESGYGNIGEMELDITANSSKDGTVYFDTEKVQKTLNRYGFDIVAVERLVDVLVINQK